MAGGQQWVAGGELGSSEKSAQDHKQIILDILEDGENVTKALKRLKPPVKRPATKRKTRATAKKGNAKADAGEDEHERQEKDKQFNLLTEAAGELMSLGFEDIYQESKSDIAANLNKNAHEGANRGGVVWHDDGTVKDTAPQEHAMYQRNTDNAALGYNDSAQAAVGATDQPARVEEQQIPTPASAVIPEHDQATLDNAMAADASAVIDPPASTDATEAEPHSGVTNAQAAGLGTSAQSEVEVDADSAAAVQNALVQPSNSLAGPAGSTPASTEAEGTSASAVPKQLTEAAQPIAENPPQQPTASDANPAAPSSEQITQAAVNQDADAAPAVVPAEETAVSQHAKAAAAVDSPSEEAPQPSAAKAAAQEAQLAPDASASDVLMAAANTDAVSDAVAHATADAYTADVSMPDSNSDAVLDAVPPAAATSVQSTSQAQASSIASTENGSALGRPFRAKGPGLGESREFAGGPMNFERPKYRHAPYGPPPIRGGGGARFGFARARSSPRGRASPTGRAFAGRGPFTEPPRSSTMRPQYGHHPPMHMPQHPFPPPQMGAYQPPPPPYHQQLPYHPPPLQAYPPSAQPQYSQYQGHPAYPTPPQQPHPGYHDQQYAAPGQPPQYGASWQQYQGAQDPNAAFQPLAAYPGPHFPPPA